jgi:hypothetical protein
LDGELTMHGLLTATGLALAATGGTNSMRSTSTA